MLVNQSVEIVTEVLNILSSHVEMIYKKMNNDILCFRFLFVIEDVIDILSIKDVFLTHKRIVK